MRLRSLRPLGCGLLLSAEKDPAIAASLAAVHPNLRVKVYNPLGTLGLPERLNPTWLETATGLLTRFGGLNQRIHNKLFIVDDRVAVTGGRNYQNAYFDQSRGLNYKDRDALVMGPVVKEMAASFDSYWRFELAIEAF